MVCVILFVPDEVFPIAALPDARSLFCKRLAERRLPESSTREKYDLISRQRTRAIA